MGNEVWPWPNACRGLVDEEEDSVRLYLLCGHCREKVEVHGVGVPPEEDPEVYLL